MIAQQKRLCLIGAGRIAAVHAASMVRLPQAQVTAVVDPAEGPGSALASTLGAKWYAVFEQALDDQTFDGVVIAAPTAWHASLIEACVSRDLPVFCEKPVDLSLDRVDHCLGVVRASGVPVLMGFHRRFDAARREIHDLVKAGALGRIEHVLQISRDPALPPESFIAHSGGMVRDMVIHDLDELIWLCGNGAVTVSANLQRYVDPSLLEKYDDHDSAAITVTFDGGPQCQISASRRSAYGFEQRLEVFGEHGMLSCPSVARGIVVKADRTGRHSPLLLDHFPQRYAAAYAAEMHHFLDLIGGAAAPICTVADARASLKLAELVLESQRTGRSLRSDLQ